MPYYPLGPVIEIVAFKAVKNPFEPYLVGCKPYANRGLDKIREVADFQRFDLGAITLLIFN
jgi:hypothetical protein